MRVDDKVSFFDENKKRVTGLVTALRPDKLNQDGKVIRKNLIDVKVSRLQGTFQSYESVPLKSDLEDGEKTFYYQLLKKEKTLSTPTLIHDSTVTSNITSTASTATKTIKSVFTKKKKQI